MKAVIIHDYCDMRIKQMDVPKTGKGELLVKTEVCGICSGDLMDWYIRKKIGSVLGHEPAGTVVEIGEGVTEFSVGDRVFAHHHAPCMVCDLCAKGQHVQCETWAKPAIEPGGMAEYFKVLPHGIHSDMYRLPDDVSFEQGAFIEPLACVVKGFLRVPEYARQGTVVVIGLGVMGMLNLMAARHWGAKTLIAADIDSARVRLANQFDVDVSMKVGDRPLCDIVGEVTGGKMADLVIVGPASLRAMEHGLSCVGRGGSLLLFSPAGPGKKLSLDVDYLYFRDISLVTSYSCGPSDTRYALDLIRKKEVNPERLITHRFDLENVNEAYCTAVKGGDTLKVMVDLAGSNKTM